MILRMTPEDEYNLFLGKCKKEKKEPTKELFIQWQDMVKARDEFLRSESYKAYEKERIRRQQRTVSQTIQEDGAVISPIDDKAYVSKHAWDDHKRANDLFEVGNENANKRKKKNEE